jgi:hypothetical protein
VVHRKVEVVAADGHIPARERRIDGIRALQLRWISLRQRGSIDAEAFFTEKASEGEPGMAWRTCTVGRRAYSGSARSLHEPFDFPVSAIFSQSSCTASSKQRVS